MIFTLWSIVIGVLLIGVTLGQSFIARLPLSAAMLYLLVGFAIGPNGAGLLHVDPLADHGLLERLTEIAVLISLFTAGLKLKLPLRDQRWRIPVQLATVSMVLTAGLVALVGVYLLGLSWGASILLGAILAPTDPVLASDVQVADCDDRDRLRFGLTGEGGLNDGTAFPLVMLGLGLLAVEALPGARFSWGWWIVEVCWAIGGALALGVLLGSLVGRAVIHLRVRQREAASSDEFIAFGLIALTYGISVLCQTYGFLAVFAAALAFRRIEDLALAVPAPEASTAQPQPCTGAGLPDPAQVPATMMQEVQRFNVQLEHFAEVGIVLAVGALLAVVEFRTEVLWFVPLLFLVIRPLSVYIGLLGTRVTSSQRRLMSWFGIRGIGSIYYLMFAITHGLAPDLAQQLVSYTIAVVVASMVAHGVSVTPLMQLYEKGRARARDRLSRRKLVLK